MADLTATQLSDLRIDIGSINAAFSDTELERFYDRMDAAEDDATRYQATIGMVIRAFLHDAAKFADYTAGETQVKKDQVYKHYKQLYDHFYADIVEPLLTPQHAQWVMVRIVPEPHQTRTEPSDA